MKKMICVVLCFLLAVPCALGEGQPKRLTESEPLYTSVRERSMELAGIFNEALHSEGYLALFTRNGYEETLPLLQMQDFTKPWDMTIVRADHALKDVQLEAALKTTPEVDFSMALEEYVRQKAYHSTGGILAAQEGTQTLALSSILTFSDAYLCPEEMDGPCFALVQYGGLYAFLVTFYPTVNGTVTVQAQFIPSRAADALNLPNE